VKPSLAAGVLVTIAALVMAGCGPRCCGAPDPGSSVVKASANNLTVQAEPGRVRAGSTVSLTVTALGPADYEVACVQTVHVWAVDSGGKTVWEEPVPAISCMAITYKHLGTGDATSFSIRWRTAASLAPGAYTIHGLFRYVLALGAGTRVRENLPPLSVEITR
jgi:hypothetical protein